MEFTSIQYVFKKPLDFNIVIIRILGARCNEHESG